MIVSTHAIHYDSVDGGVSTQPNRSEKWPTLPHAPPAPSNEVQPRQQLPTIPHPPPPVPGELLEQWLDLAARAPDPHTALDFAQRAIDLRPDDPRAQASVLRCVVQRLGQDAFVAYMAETSQKYVVSFRNSRPLAVPKTRAQPEDFPPAHLTSTDKLWRLIGFMVLGLLPAGLGALFVSPFVLSPAVAILTNDHADPREQRSAWLALFLGSLIGVVGLLLVFVLVLHIIA